MWRNTDVKPVKMFWENEQRPGPIFYLLSWSPSHLEFFLQVTWPFSIFTLMTWKPGHLAKSQVTSVADLQMSWVASTSLFVFCIFLNSYMWHGMFYNSVETLYSTIYYSKYFIELNIDKSTLNVALWTHKRHPIPRPFGRAMECLLWVLQQKLIVL